METIIIFTAIVVAIGAVYYFSTKKVDKNHQGGGSGFGEKKQNKKRDQL